MTEKRKRLSLGDRIREAAARDINSQESQDARARLARLTLSQIGATPDQDLSQAGATPEQHDITPVSGEGQIGSSKVATVATQGQDSGSTVARHDQDPINTGARPDQDPSNIGARHDQDPNNIGATPDQDLINTGARPDQDPSNIGARPDQDPINTGARPDQDPINTGARPDQDPSNIGARPEQDPINTGARPELLMSKTRPDHALLMSKTRSRPDQDPSRTPSKNHAKTAEKTARHILTSQQFCIYKWFKKNGSKGYFNKSIIEKETGTTFITIRRALEKFQQIGLISLGGFNQAIKRQEYILAEGIDVICLEAELAEQGLQPEGARHEQDMSKTHPDSSYKERKILLNNLKNLSFFLKNSDFWKKQSLTQKRIERWMTEFDMDEKFIIQQLQMAEADPNVTAADDPMDYLYRCFVKTGGIKKPKNFEFPEERMARLKAESLAASEALLKKQDEIRQREKELAKKEAFLLFLQNEEAVLEGIVEIEKSYVTPKLKVEIDLYKSSRNIGERLENRLKIYFESD